ncbi:MAG: hypothetical protein RML12_00620 [Xanthomonadales bacterium]|nr:hypothetical protein [Xanthomonadales bacterium]
MLEEHEAEALFREAAEAALAAPEESGHVAELLRRYGGDAARLRADLARLLGIRERFRGLLGTDAQARDSLKDALRQHLGAELGALDTGALALPGRAAQGAALRGREA